MNWDKMGNDLAFLASILAVITIFAVLMELSGIPFPT